MQSWFSCHSQRGEAGPDDVVVLPGAGGGPPGPPGGGGDGKKPNKWDGFRGVYPVETPEGEEEEEDSEEDELTRVMREAALHWYTTNCDSDWIQTPGGKAFQQNSRLVLWLRNGPKRCNRCHENAYLGGGIGCISPQCQYETRQNFRTQRKDNKYGSIPALLYPALFDDDSKEALHLSIDEVSVRDDEEKVPQPQYYLPYAKPPKKNKGLARKRPPEGRRRRPNLLWPLGITRRHQPVLAWNVWSILGWWGSEPDFHVKVRKSKFNKCVQRDSCMTIVAISLPSVAKSDSARF